MSLTLLYVGIATNICAQQSEIRKVVIDAGHGGKDPGTVHGKIKEKDIVLAVSLKLGKLIKQHYPAVEVLYTRTKDVYVEFDERSNVANKNHADLFISIHVNAEDGGTRASGSETYIMGAHKTKANMAVAQRENSVVLYEDDYTTKYEGFDPNSPESYIIFSLMQNVHLEQSSLLASFAQKEFGNSPIKVNRGVKQGGFLVLWKTAAPSILVELGFLSNPADRSVLANDKQQDRIALSILNAFTRYKNTCEKTGAASYIGTNTRTDAEHPNAATAPAASSSSTVASTNNTSKNTTYYRVQIMSIGKVEPSTSKLFKGHKDVRYIKVGNLYKYMLGNYTKKTDADTLSKNIQKDFPGAFVIAVQDEKIIPAN